MSPEPGAFCHASCLHLLPQGRWILALLRVRIKFKVPWRRDHIFNNMNLYYFMNYCTFSQVIDSNQSELPMLTETTDSPSYQRIDRNRIICKIQTVIYKTITYFFSLESHFQWTYLHMDSLINFSFCIEPFTELHLCAHIIMLRGNVNSG